jgi:hypothetical protein
LGSAGVWPRAAAKKETEEVKGVDEAVKADGRSELADLAVRIEREHLLALAAARSAIDHAVRCGQLLREAKRRIAHGAWIGWLSANTGLTPRVAQNYMKIAANAPILTANTNFNSHLTLTAALVALAKHKPAPAIPAQRAFLNGRIRAGSIELRYGDCLELLPRLRRSGDVVVSDVPYNVGIAYDGYDDHLPPDEYAGLIRAACQPPCVIISYPELMVRIAMILGMEPSRICAWVFHSNTPRQWRAVSWFGVEPDLSRLRQPYKNPTDARIQELVEAGSDGCALYDWWHIEQVKNVSNEKTEHPCQTPVEVMRNIIAITPCDGRIIDPFMGSGTTLVAAKELGKAAIGIEQSDRYCAIARDRLAEGDTK